MRFPAPAAAPPIVLLLAAPVSKPAMPYSPPWATVPEASVPMRLPSTTLFVVGVALACPNLMAARGP